MLIDLYLTTENQADCQSVINQLELRLENASHSSDQSFKAMNELGTILRKHNNLELAAQFYKKSLLCIKRRHKQEFLSQFETSKVLVNLASVYYLLKYVPEALKYFNHALEVLGKIQDSAGSEPPEFRANVCSELAKVHMSVGSLHKELREVDSAKSHFDLAIDTWSDYESIVFKNGKVLKN